MTMARDRENMRIVGTFTRAFSRSFNGDMVFRMIGAAGTTDALGFHEQKYRAFKFSLSQPGPLAAPAGGAPLPPGLTLPPGAFDPTASSASATKFTPVAPPPGAAVGKAPPTVAPPPASAAPLPATEVAEAPSAAPGASVSASSGSTAAPDAATPQSAEASKAAPELSSIFVKSLLACAALAAALCV
jgi:hypothetical protein